MEVEGCFLARVDPWRRLDRVSDEEVLAVVRRLQPLMRRSAEGGGRDDNCGLRAHWPALPPLRRAHPLARPGRRQPHDLLVPLVPGVIRVGHKGADHVAPGNTVESFEAARAWRRHDRVRRAAGARRATRPRPRLRGRRGARLPDARGGAPSTSRARPTAGWSWTSTSSCPATRSEVVEGCASAAWPSARSSRRCTRPGAAGRARTRAAARLVGAACGAVPALPAGATRLRDRARHARAPARAGRGQISSGGCEAIMAHQVLVSRRLGGAFRRRRALRVDGRRRRSHRGARGARRRRRDHERPAAVQPLMLQGPVTCVAVRLPPLISATTRGW